MSKTPDAAPPQWDQLDLPAFVELEQIAPGKFRSVYGDANLNGRAYGGQSIAHALMACARTAPDDRSVSALSVLFLKGTDPARPVDFEVTALQDGGRFSSRHLRGRQDGTGNVVEAYATFCMASEGPDHSSAVSTMPTGPDELASIDALPAHVIEQLSPLGPYARHVKPAFDFRVPDMDQQMTPATATSSFRYWIKTRCPLPACNRTHAAVFAFLSDWWLNFSTVSAHVRNMGHSGAYIASLNHSIWFHRSFAADDWMLFESESPCAAGGRGLSIARVRDRSGQVIASVTQESLVSRMKPATSS